MGLEDTESDLCLSKIAYLVEHMVKQLSTSSRCSRRFLGPVAVLRVEASIKQEIYPASKRVHRN